MAIKFDVNDDFGKCSLFDIFLNPLYSSHPFKGRVINEEDYEIIPRKSKVEKDIKVKEEELSLTEQRKKNDMQFYDSKIKSLQLELDQLRQRLSK